MKKLKSNNKLNLIYKELIIEKEIAKKALVIFFGNSKITEEIKKAAKEKTGFLIGGLPATGKIAKSMQLVLKTTIEKRNFKEDILDVGAITSLVVLTISCLLIGVRGHG